MNNRQRSWLLGTLIFASSTFTQSLFADMGVFTHNQADSAPTKVIEIKAPSKKVRNEIANLGYALEDLRSDRVFVYGSEGDVNHLSNLGYQVRSWPIKNEWLDLHSKGPGGKFTSLAEVKSRLEALVSKNPQIASIDSIGRSIENRDVMLLRISGQSKAQAEAAKTPVAFYMGCHHAREHLSVEVPLKFAEYLVAEYGKNQDITRLVNEREIYIAPVINPDGHTHDYSDGIRGKMWRKNRRRNADGTFGVDLNRNYGFGWGTGGSSKDPKSDTYMGTAPFSEPETQNVKAFVESQPRMSVLLSFHSFSELILYPWGHTEDSIGDGEGYKEDLNVFKKMAQDMSQWNHYTPEQSSDLYIASGDTTDWAYGEFRIFAFTFELTPTSLWDGGFYPNPAQTIEPAFSANLKPMLYMLEYAENPYRVLSKGKGPSFEKTPAKAGLRIASYKDAI